MPSDFAILGLPDTATLAQAKAARKKLARENHPDKSGVFAPSQNLSEINAAFDRIAAASQLSKTGSPPTQGLPLGWKATEEMLGRMKSFAMEAMIKGGHLTDITTRTPRNMPGIHFLDNILLSGGILHVNLKTSASDGRNFVIYPRIAFPAGDQSDVSISKFRFESVEIQTTRSARGVTIGKYDLRDGSQVRVIANFDPKGGTYNAGLLEALKAAAAEKHAAMVARILQPTAKGKRPGILSRMKRAFARD